jgi:hypothetical protein
MMKNLKTPKEKTVKCQWYLAVGFGLILEVLNDARDDLRATNFVCQLHLLVSKSEKAISK